MFDPIRSGNTSPTPGATPSETRHHPGTGSRTPDTIAPLPNPLLDPLRCPAPDADPLRPRASIFVTPLGHELMARIPAVPTGPVAGSALAAVPELKTGSDTRRQIARAAGRIAEAPAPALLLLGGGHHVASSLTMFHAAIDACRKHGMVLCLEHRAELLDQLDPLLKFLLHEPKLKKALGSNTLHSRRGQAIAWDYVRTSGDRGALQRFLPELLAWNEIRHRDIPLAFVDSLGIEGGSDEVREDLMFARTRARLGRDQRGVLLGGLAHSTPIQAACLRAGLNTHCLVVFDETADDLQRLYDVGDDPTRQTSIAADTFQHNLNLPHCAAVAPRTESYRVGFEVHPFS